MSDKIKAIQNYCSYCKSTDCSNLIQCLGDNCGKWFCNNKNGNNGSHIYFHLKFSHHRKISIPSELPSISCSHCKKDDVYSLSVFAYKNITEILCSDICKNSKFEVFSTRVTSLIEENRISYHVLPQSDKLIAEEEKISVVDIEQLEKIWRENPDISESEAFEKLKKFKKFYLPNVRDKYESEQELEKVFVALVEAEAWHEKEVLEKMVQHNVEVQWKTGHTEVYAELNLFNSIHFEGRLKVGDFLLISGEDIPKLKGMVKRVKEGKKLMVSFQQPKAPENIGKRYTVTPSFNGVTYKRMLEGLSDFASGQAMSPNLMLHLLGKHEEIEDSQPKKEPYALSDCTKFERFDLNDSQKEAALRALNAAYLFLIQGPPGTGKTHTLAAIIAQAFEKLGRYAKMLVCGPSNKAIDVITKKLIQNGVTGVCRIYAVSKEKTKVDPELESVSLHKMIQEANPRLKFLMKRKENEELLSDDERDELIILKQQVEQEVVARSRVICCTCVVAGDKRLKNVIFKNVFVDEAAQATEPECLLPLLHNAEKVILCGDHKQIGPIIKSTEAKRAGFSRSLFERLITTNPDNHYMLRYQYRMHPEIAEFPSKHFYDDLLVPHHTVLQRRMKLNAPFPTDTPNFFYHIRGKEEIPVTGVSQMNRDEAQAVKKIVYTLLDSGVSPQQIGVITPYNGQKMHLTELIEKRPSLQGKIDISSVDGFQGGEKDFIIISCVRSNKEIGLGFLVDPQRLNVALTRAKYGLIVVGNAEVLRQDSNWGALLEYYSEKGHLLSGELTRLRPYKMKSQE